jgi:hypothetical protein
MIQTSFGMAFVSPISIKPEQKNATLKTNDMCEQQLILLVAYLNGTSDNKNFA